VSQKYIADKYLNNKDYFSAGNKKFFNVLKTECYELGENIGIIIEHQGEFLRGGNNHTSLKIVSINKKIITVTGGFNHQKNGLYLYRDIRDFLKKDLGFYEKQVIKSLDSISLSRDYKDTLLFKNSNNQGFYLTIDNNMRIISHL